MTTPNRAELIATYKAGPEAVRAALADITEAELDHRPAPGEWTPREIVQHLADSEMVIASRFRYLLATDNPPLIGFDQDAWVARFAVPGAPIATDLALFTAVRAATGAILDRVTETEWTRYGTHSELGQITVEAWLRRTAGHAHTHAEQIRAARESAQTRAARG